ncbi:MAG TPA: SURF1 family protein [Gemmatimonadaceae bacterium]
MSISRATVFFGAFAVAVSLGCVRLGFWQLERLSERRASNALVMARLAEAAVPLQRLPHNSTVRFRRATARGTYDFENEFVVTSRSRHGSPGVHVITPLRMSTNDTALLVNRGWAYSPDGMRVDLALFREDSIAVVDGFVEEYSAAEGPVATPSVERAVRRLDRDSIAARVPYPLAAMVLVQQLDSGEATAVDRGTPVRVEPPPLDEGPHRAYAIQWFAFAIVGIVGTFLVLQRDRMRRTSRGTNPG